jgi:hypothetical protein
MTREQVRKLLGGYAAGTLTEAEETALFEAALEDQDLFDELGREQALRDLLSDPAARAHLLAALDEPRPAWGQRAARWIFGNAVGLAAVACLGCAMTRRHESTRRQSSCSKKSSISARKGSHHAAGRSLRAS